jgi:hypothetical protein
MPSASQSLSREAAPLDQRGRASPFVNLAGHEMTLLVEMIVDLSEITTVPSNQETTGTLADWMVADAVLRNQSPKSFIFSNTEAQ